MPRPRKHNKHLPAGMYFRHGAYYYAKGNRWTRLGKDYGPALVAYADLVGRKPRVVTVKDAIGHYMESSARRLKPATLEGYRYAAANVGEVFGHMALTELEPSHVFDYLTIRGTVQANRDKALLSAAYTHARRIGAFRGDDPTKGIRYRNPEKPRQRYVTDAELQRAVESASPKLATILRFAYLTGLRVGDTLKVRMADLQDDGIHTTASKTGKRQVIEWSPELREVVDEARVLWRRFGREWLFESKPRGRQAKRGPGPYTPSGLRALWRVAREKAGLSDVRLHDLRGKAGSDVSAEDAQRLLGHTDGKVTRRHYRRRPEVVKPVR